MNPIDFVMKAERCDCVTAAKKIQRMLNITDFSEVKRRVPAEDKREVIALPYRLIDISVKNRLLTTFLTFAKSKLMTEIIHSCELTTNENKVEDVEVECRAAREIG